MVVSCGFHLNLKVSTCKRKKSALEILQFENVTCMHQLNVNIQIRS